MAAPPAPVPNDDGNLAAPVARTYEAGIVLSRWAATVLDVGVGILTLLACGFSSQYVGEWIFGVWFVGALAYYVVLEGRWGVTVGKLALKLRVVDAQGRPPGYGRAATRTLLRLIEVNPFLLGGIPAGVVAGLSKTKQRLGDMAAGTYVLRVADVQRLRALSVF